MYLFKLDNIKTNRKNNFFLKLSDYYFNNYFNFPTGHLSFLSIFIKAFIKLIKLNKKELNFISTRIIKLTFQVLPFGVDLTNQLLSLCLHGFLNLLNIIKVVIFSEYYIFSMLVTVFQESP
jgi:hypothetical protein